MRAAGSTRMATTESLDGLASHHTDPSVSIPSNHTPPKEDSGNEKRTFLVVNSVGGKIAAILVSLTHLPAERVGRSLVLRPLLPPPPPNGANVRPVILAEIKLVEPPGLPQRESHELGPSLPAPSRIMQAPCWPNKARSLSNPGMAWTELSCMQMGTFLASRKQCQASVAL